MVGKCVRRAWAVVCILALTAIGEAGQLGQTSGGGTAYPAALDTASTKSDVTACNTTISTKNCAKMDNDLQAAIIAIETELGLSPSDSYSTVKARLDAVTASGVWADQASGAFSAERDMGALTTGLVLNTVTASVGVPSAYTGATCTNQFLRSLDASGAGTCATVADADVANTITLDNITQITTRSHTSLSDIGTNTHAQVDSHIAATVAHGATGAVVGTTNAQALTYKTLDGGIATTTHAAGANVLQTIRHATDCTAITDGLDGEACYEQDANALYVCEPTAGGCDTPGEWILNTAGTISGLLVAGNMPKADVLQGSLSCPDLGSTDAYACSLTPAITAYVTGTHYRVKANTANTTAATINLNSLGAITIVKATGGITTGLATNDIREGQWVDLVYDGTNMQMQSTLGNAAIGTGDVVGPSSSVDNGIVRYDGTTGKLVQGYTSNTPTCSDTGVCTFPGGIVSGSGSGVAGGIDFLEGTASSLVANTVSYFAPANVADGGIAFVSPAAAATGIPHYTNSAGVMTESISLINLATDLTGTVTERIYMEVAGCNGATAGPVWNSPTTNAPAYTCEGTNTLIATADFDATTDESITRRMRIPTGFTGTMDVIFIWKAAATSGAVGWCFQMVRVPTGSTSDPALPAQASGNCVSSTVAGTTLQEVSATITGVTCTSCVETDRVNVRVSRDADGSAVTDSMTGDAKLIDVLLLLNRTLP